MNPTAHQDSRTARSAAVPDAQPRRWEADWL
jgi:hypothetical protein